MKLRNIIRDELQNHIAIDNYMIASAVRAAIENMDLEDMIEESLTRAIENLVHDTVEEILDDVIEDEVNNIEL